jgi:hypothetical protein
MTIVRCRCCHREENWRTESDGTRIIEVLLAGGQRRSAQPPVDAWRTLRAAREATTGPVVGECPGCAQPMIASDTTFPALTTWTIHARDGDLRVGGIIEGPAGAMDVDHAEKWLLRQYRASWLPTGGDVLGGAFVFPLLVVPGCWMFAILFLISFFATGFRTDPWVLTKVIAALAAGGVLIGALGSAFERKR